MKKRLLSLAKIRFGGVLFSWVVAHMSFLIPSDRLYETEKLVAFEHPSPSYETHILIVPKQRLRSLLDLDPSDTGLLEDLIRCLQALVPNLVLGSGGYRLVVNGGEAQEVEHLHFHLIAGEVIDADR